MTLKTQLVNALIALALTACAPSSDPSAVADSRLANASTTAGASSGTSAAAPIEADPLLMTVHKNASCGCCNSWVQHLRENGFRVNERNVDNLAPVKVSVGVSYGMGACHTAEVGGYFIEGHVPAADIKRLLAEHPDAKGLTVPAMPVGSPGMETPTGEVQPYDVFLVARDGSASVFAHHGD